MATSLAAFAVLSVWLCGVHAATVPKQGNLRQVEIQSYTVEAEEDRVVDLPGLGKPDFGLFSGYVHFLIGQSGSTASTPHYTYKFATHVLRYVTVNEEAERALFYAFAESQSNPRGDPLVLWLNGYVLPTCMRVVHSERVCCIHCHFLMHAVVQVAQALQVDS